MSFGDYLKLVGGIGIPAAAATCSGTIIKADLLPLQLRWLGILGSVVAGCALVVAFLLKSFSSKVLNFVICLLIVGLCVSCTFLQLSRVRDVTINGVTENYLVGNHHTATAEAFANMYHTKTEDDLIRLAGVDAIPQLYSDYNLSYIGYAARSHLINASRG